MIMKRRNYQKPTMQVIELQHHTMILAVSTGASATMSVTYEEEDF